MFEATKFTVTILAAVLATGVQAAMPAKSDPRIAAFCGAEHKNELASADEVLPNPSGFFVKTTGEQIDIRDTRVVWTKEDEPYLCSTPVGNPMMHHAQAVSVQGKRTVRFLFIPNSKTYPASLGR